MANLISASIAGMFLGYIGAFLTHKDYDQWNALTGKRKAEWLQF
jgi:hypothetical protein